MSIIFNQICIDEEMLPNIHIHIYIYIYIEREREKERERERGRDIGEREYDVLLITIQKFTKVSTDEPSSIKHF